MFSPRGFGRFRSATIGFLCAIATGLAFGQCCWVDAQEQNWTVYQNVPVNISLQTDGATSNFEPWTLNALADNEFGVAGQQPTERSALQSVMANLFVHQESSVTDQSSMDRQVPLDDRETFPATTITIADQETIVPELAKDVSFVSYSLETVTSRFLFFAEPSDQTDTSPLIEDQTQSGNKSNIEQVNFQSVGVEATRFYEVDSIKTETDAPLETSVLFDANVAGVHGSSDCGDDAVDALATQANITVGFNVHPCLSDIASPESAKSIDSVIATDAFRRKTRFLFEDELPPSGVVSHWHEIWTTVESLDCNEFLFHPISFQASSPPIHASDLKLAQVEFYSSSTQSPIDGIDSKDWIFRREWIPNDMFTETIALDIQSTTSQGQEFFGIFNDAIDAELLKWASGENVHSNRATQDDFLSAGVKDKPKPRPLNWRIDLDSEIAKRVFYYDDELIGGYVAVFGETSPKNQPGVPTFSGDLTYSGAVSLVDWNWILQSQPSIPVDFEPRQRKETFQKSILTLTAPQRVELDRSDWAEASEGLSYWLIYKDKSARGTFASGRKPTNWSDVSVRETTPLSELIDPNKPIRSIKGKEKKSGRDLGSPKKKR